MEDWIPCTKELPKENQQVMITYRNKVGRHVGKATFKNEAFYYIGETPEIRYEEMYSTPLAWLPLPNPYMSSKNKEHNTDKDWITCIKGLPEENQDVIITFRDRESIYVCDAVFKNDGFYYIAEVPRGTYEELYSIPLAWMPYPRVYEG